MQMRPAVDEVLKTQNKTKWYGISAASEDSDFQIILQPTLGIQTKCYLVPHCLIISQATKFQIPSSEGIKPNKWVSSQAATAAVLSGNAAPKHIHFL